MGLAFWYVAGLAWGWPIGLVGPAAGVLVAVLMGLPAMIVGWHDVADAFFSAGMVAAIGSFGYPLGLLARLLVLAFPIVGLGSGGLVLVLGISVIVDATSSVYDGVQLDATFAPAMLLAGGGTLAVSAWLMVRGRQEVSASVPTADDRD